MSKRRKKFLQRNYKAIIVVLLIAAGVIYWIRDADHKETMENKELFSSESPYQLLENNDSIHFVANIVLNENRSILQIAEDYYKKDIFWPYIFNSNPKITDILNLKSGTILKLPRLSVALTDTLNPESIQAAKKLGDSILTSIEEDRLQELEKQSFSEW